MELLRCIKDLLYVRRLTIEGAQKEIKNRGLKALIGETIQNDFFADVGEDNRSGRKFAAGNGGRVGEIFVRRFYKLWMPEQIDIAVFGQKKGPVFVEVFLMS